MASFRCLLRITVINPSLYCHGSRESFEPLLCLIRSNRQCATSDMWSVEARSWKGLKHSAKGHGETSARPSCANQASDHWPLTVSRAKDTAIAKSLRAYGDGVCKERGLVNYISSGRASRDRGS